MHVGRHGPSGFPPRGGVCAAAAKGPHSPRSPKGVANHAARRQRPRRLLRFAARRRGAPLIGRVLRARWDDCRGLSILGLGFAGPLLERFRDEAQRTLALHAGRGWRRALAGAGTRRLGAGRARHAAAARRLDRPRAGRSRSGDRRAARRGAGGSRGGCWRRTGGRSSLCRRGAASGRGSTARRSARASPIRRRNCAS